MVKQFHAVLKEGDSYVFRILREDLTYLRKKEKGCFIFIIAKEYVVGHSFPLRLLNLP